MSYTIAYNLLIYGMRSTVMSDESIFRFRTQTQSQTESETESEAEPESDVGVKINISNCNCLTHRHKSCSPKGDYLNQWFTYGRASYLHKRNTIMLLVAINVRFHLHKVTNCTPSLSVNRPSYITSRRISVALLMDQSAKTFF